MCNLTQFMCNLTAVCLKNRDDQTASVCWSMRVPNPNPNPNQDAYWSRLLSQL